jgi:hypothetical protein
MNEMSTLLKELIIGAIIFVIITIAAAIFFKNNVIDFFKNIFGIQMLLGLK